MNNQNYNGTFIKKGDEQVDDTIDTLALSNFNRRNYSLNIVTAGNSGILQELISPESRERRIKDSYINWTSASQLE